MASSSNRNVTGKLLVAAPSLVDPNFARTVVLVLEHSPLGALGVVLNRPGEVPVKGPLPEWEPLVCEPSVLFYGGPVSPEAAIALAEARPGTPLVGWQSVLAEVGVLDLSMPVEAARSGVARMRVFSGYAGWAPNQLDGELAAGGWIVAEAHPDDAVTAEPEQLWARVLRRQRGLLAALARFPDDPSLN